MDHGDHLCLAFTDDAEQRRVVTTYLASGLHRGERVMHFADQLAPQAVLDWLTASGTDPRPALEKGQLVVTTADDSYLATGSFDADGMVATLRQEVRESLTAGYTGFRVSGEMGWALRQVPGADRLADYETKVNQVFAGQRASAVCQYDARRFTPDQLGHLHGCHPGAVEPEPLYHDSTLRLVSSFRGGRCSLRVVGSVDHRASDAFADALETALTWRATSRWTCRRWSSST